jgi:hypothetical protein
MLETRWQFVGAEASRQTQGMETAQAGLAPLNIAAFLFSSLLLKGTNTGELRLAINGRHAVTLRPVKLVRELH